MLSFSIPLFTLLFYSTPGDATPVPALYYSQINSRQFGGIIPSRNAEAIIPLCRLSDLSTWHRRHRVRRFINSFVASFPLLMWSMWHSSKVWGESQWTHLRLSLSQTLRRVSLHISRGCLDLGISVSHALPGPSALRRSDLFSAFLGRSDLSFSMSIRFYS